MEGDQIGLFAGVEPQKKRTGLSKTRIMTQLQCPKALWLKAYKPEEAGERDTSRLEMGHRVGELAHSLFPGGVLVDTSEIPAALADTRNHLQAKVPIYEAAFSHQGVLVFVDLLIPEGDGYHLIEVKSSTQVKSYHQPDAAIQTWVAEQAGVRITRTSIAHINNQFVYPGNSDYDGLFTISDITAVVSELKPDVVNWVNAAKVTLGGLEPAIAMGSQCNDPFECPFQGYCSPPESERPRYPVSDLPRGGSAVQVLIAEGHHDLATVPPELIASDMHRRVHRAVIDGEPFLAEELPAQVAAIPYPRYYIDFETTQFAIPIWVGTRPYQQIPFQWSCHVEAADGSITHHEFLAEAEDGDPRYAFAQSLVDVLGNEGAILVYNARFEKGVMRDLAGAFPEFESPLLAALDRVVDLLPIARDGYYHRDMHGSWSIKKVLPTVAPDLSYANLEISGGDEALDTFRRMVEGEIPEDEIANMREALLEYCKQDTYAMVRLAHYFEGRTDA